MNQLVLDLVWWALFIYGGWTILDTFLADAKHIAVWVWREIWTVLFIVSIVWWLIE